MAIAGPSAPIAVVAPWRSAGSDARSPIVERTKARRSASQAASSQGKAARFVGSLPPVSPISSP